MSAFEAGKNSVRSSIRKDVELAVVEPTKHLVRIVVNNYRESGKGEDVENQETPGIMNNRKGLPPQQVGYLKLPTYDWF